MTPAPRLLQAARCLKLIALLLWICAGLAVAFPRASDQRRLHLKQLWSRQILQTLGIRADMPDKAFLPGSLVLANHISWLDILAINAVTAVAFVSKAEVRQWPLLGWIAEKKENKEKKKVIIYRESIDAQAKKKGK